MVAKASSGDRVAGPPGVGDLRGPRCSRGAAGQLEQGGRPVGVFGGHPLRVADQGVPAGVLLPAAEVAAAALHPAGDGLHVAELAAHAPAAPVDGAAEDEAAADAGADGDGDEVALAPAGAEAELAPGHRVGVVLHHDGQAGHLGEPALERLLAPGEVGGEADDAAGLVDEPGGADADGLDLVLVGQFLDRLGHGLGDLGRVVGRGRLQETLDDQPVGVDDARRDLGAADVDTDGQRHVVCLPSGSAQIDVFYLRAPRRVTRSVRRRRALQGVDRLPEGREQLASRRHQMVTHVAAGVPAGRDHPAHRASPADVLLVIMP